MNFLGYVVKVAAKRRALDGHAPCGYENVEVNSGRLARNNSGNAKKLLH
jgi:hypothetical protein